MTSERIEELMKKTAYPESNSVHQAMLQVWNELQQDFNNRTCDSCKYGFKESDTHILCNQDYYVTDAFGDDIYEPLVFVSANFGCNKWEAKDAK